MIASSLDIAKDLKDWPSLERAVEKHVGEQRLFVEWWKANVSEYHGRPKKSADPRTFRMKDAEQETGISNQQVSKWSRWLKDEETYRKRLYGAAYHQAMGGVHSHKTTGTGNDEWYTPPQYIEQWLAEIKCRAMTRIGELSAKLEKAKPQKGHGAGLTSTGKTKADVLKSAGISTSVANRCEVLARNSDKVEAFIEKAAEDKKVIKYTEVVTTIQRLHERDDALTFVLSLNLHRLHVDESQRALVAAKIAKLPAHRPAVGSAPIGAVSQDDAADQLHVGRRSVQRARKILEAGSAELVAAVERTVSGGVVVQGKHPGTRPAPQLSFSGRIFGWKVSQIFWNPRESGVNGRRNVPPASRDGEPRPRMTEFRPRGTQLDLAFTRPHLEIQCL